MNKKLVIYYCKESDCNNKICYETVRRGKGRCRSCSHKGTKNHVKKEYKNILTKVFLNKEYNKKKKSIWQIGKETKINGVTIWNYLIYYKFKMRNRKKENNNFYDKHHTEGTKKKISKANKGKLKGTKNPNYINGLGNLPYSSEFNNELKAKIRKRDNYTCQKCGITEEEHVIVYGMVLTVHHIDYDKENCKEKNLITACRECNLRVNYNRNYWVKYFKKILKEKRNG